MFFNSEEKLMYILNRLKMSTVITYYYIDLGEMSKCQHRKVKRIVSMLKHDATMEPVVGICMYGILILSILGMTFPLPQLHSGSEFISRWGKPLIINA